jgi:hypothetical protein
MKKIVSALLLLALLVCSPFVLASCDDGGLSGTYKGDLCTLKFKGERVTAIIGDNELIGEYDIDTDHGEKNITLEFVDFDEATTTQKQLLDVISGILYSDMPFVEDGNTIKIGVFTFVKK